MLERLDLGPCEAIRHDGDPRRCALLLPGQWYPTRAPVLWFAREALTAQGFSALEVLGEPGENSDPVGWLRDSASAALDAAAGAEQVLAVGKSLASLLTGWAREHELAAVWLTPLLGAPAMTDGLAGARRPALLVGGTADPAWEPAAIPRHPLLQTLEIPGVDHALQARGDLPRSLAALETMTGAVSQFVQRL